MLINDIPFQPLPIFLSISQARRSNKEATAYPSIYHPGSRSSQQTNVSSGLFSHRKLATISREYRSPITGHKKQSSLSLSLSPPLPTFLSPSSKDKGSFRNKKTMVTTYHLDRRLRLSRCFIRRNGKLEHGKKAWQNDRRRGFRGLMKRSGRKDENKKKKRGKCLFHGGGALVRDVRRYNTWSLWAIESAERGFRLHISLFSTAVLPPIDTRIPPFSPPPPPVCSSS